MLALILNSALLGIGLAMDACAVSMANGLNEPKMRVKKICLIAGTFALFQALMPLLGWLCIHFITQEFAIFTVAVPYIALALLLMIGGKMLFDGIKQTADAQREAKQKALREIEKQKHPENFDITEEVSETESAAKTLTIGVLLTQALATSIDALSVGFTIAEYDVTRALICAAIIATVTFAICFAAVFLGKKFGTKLGNRAEILGGIILIGIGIEIFVTGVFF